jgi:hypothetical protein
VPCLHKEALISLGQPEAQLWCTATLSVVLAGGRWQVLWRTTFPGADVHFIENGAMFPGHGPQDAEIMVR